KVIDIPSRPVGPQFVGDQPLHSSDLVWIEEVNAKRTDMRLCAIGPELKDADMLVTDRRNLRPILGVRIRVLALRVEDQLTNRSLTISPASLGHNKGSCNDNFRSVRFTHTGHAEQARFSADKVMNIDRHGRVVLLSRLSAPTRGRVSHSADTYTFHVFLGRLQVGGNFRKPISDWLQDSIRRGGVEVINIRTKIQALTAVDIRLVEGPQDPASETSEGNPILREGIEVYIQDDRGRRVAIT